MSTAVSDRLAVCSWSLQPADLSSLIASLQAVGIPRVQLALDPLREHPELWRDLAPRFAGHGFSCVSGMFGTLGEDYSTPESIKRTGGVVPDATWDQNWHNIQADVEIAVALGLKLVTFHAGFLPHDESDLQFRKLLDRIARIADLFAAHQLDLGFETGQETAETLRSFLEQLNRPNVGVNFDPANMILYEKGDPIAALRTLGPWLQQVHLKDALATKVPGTWGEEVVVGTGQVDWEEFFRVLSELKFGSSLCIEREAGTQRVIDIRAARGFVTEMCGR